MIANTIENIYVDFMTNYANSPEKAIEFYQKNAIYLSNVQAFKDKIELKLYIEIIGKYIESIQQKDRWTLTIDLANKHLIFIDSELERLNADGAKGAWYNAILFNIGVSNYRLKEYSTASKIFKKLVDVDNKNDNYKLWLKYSEFEERMWIIRLITIASGCLMIIGIFFKKHIPSYQARMSIDGIALVGLSFSFMYEYYMKLKFRKLKGKI